MSMPSRAGTQTVAFDESGNTGQDLLNVDSPVFALASVKITDDEAQEFLRIVPVGAQAKEAHFTKLKKIPDGQAGIAALLNSELIARDRVKIVIYDKVFMATCKMVDVLIEPLLYNAGIDLTDEGRARGMANMWHVAMRPIIGDESYRRLQAAFVRMMRDRTDVSVDAFYEIVSEAITTMGTAPHENTINNLRMLEATRYVLDEAFLGFELTQLDPTIPAFILLGASWSGQIGENFRVLFDDSKPIKHEAQLLEDISREHEAADYDHYGEKMVFPLKTIIPFEFGSSVKHPSIQVADLLAGAATHWMRGILYGDRDGFWELINASHLKSLVIDVQSATPDVTPDELGMKGRSHRGMREHITSILSTSDPA